MERGDWEQNLGCDLSLAEKFPLAFPRIQRFLTISWDLYIAWVLLVSPFYGGENGGSG